MKSVTKLKDDARRHELREDWEKAIAVYLQVIRIGEQGEADLELPLYNRVGDLYVRVGKPDDAVLYYEQAADRYAEAGLFNNAIALCNKALRYAPDHLELIRKLGQFSASQGFLTDARRWFLDFAERASKQGRIDDALGALESFANTSDDPEVRELLGRRLHQYGHAEEAITELRRAYRMYLGEENDDKADGVRAFLAEIAPAVSLEGEVPELPVERTHEPDSYSASIMRPDRTDSEAEAGAEGGAGAEAGTGSGAGTDAGGAFESGAALADADADAEALGDGEQLAGLMPTARDDADAVDEADVLEGFQPTSFDTEPEDDYGAVELPDLEPTGEEAVEAAAHAMIDLPDLEPTSVEPGELPLLEGDATTLPELEPTADTFDLDEDDAGSGFDLPLLHPDGETTPDAGGEPHVQIETPLDVIEDALSDARAALAVADAATAVARLQELHTRLEDDTSFGFAVRGVAALLLEAPDEIRLHQVRVEFAERSGDRSLRLGSYIDLARALERTNAPQKAAAMYEHVLELDPGNADATEALAAMRPAPADGYVDLKSLFDLDAPSGETRYFVEETEPTGDEDNDFAAILSQFKAKLAEHVAPEEAAAHYDLGIAFKEMGLVDEAIAEFQVALRAGDERLKIYEELGHCFLLKQQYTVAAKVLGRGLEMPVEDEIDRIGVYYHLGTAYEQLGRIDDARDAFERVMSLDINFRDVARRLESL